MKLILAIVNRDDTEAITRALTNHGFCSTQLGTTGGFLKTGNVTILIGVDEERVQDVIAVIREQCHCRSQVAEPRPGAGCSGLDLEVVVGGATIFVVDIEHFERV